MSVHKKTQAQQFHAEYERICFLQDIYPVPHVTANLKDNFLDINSDKIRTNEWSAIFDALKVNNSLRYVALRSLWKPVNPDEKKKPLKKKTPPIRSREMTLKLSRSLKDCLFISQSLECLILQNVPLREQDIRLLSKGISKSTCLKYFSLEQCGIGDECFETLITSIKTSLSLLSINFSGCNLTWKSASLVAMIIKFQASQRHGEAWQDSLRYRRPDLDCMHGLRRITLCDNMISDQGARILADAIKDDLWLKALDLQQCSISTDGAQILKDSLCYNRSLWILDLRRNQQITYDLLRSIIEQVMINAAGEHAEYPWISREETMEKSKVNQRKSPRNNPSKKNQVKGAKVRRRDSAENYSKLVHYPWRTGERIKANRYRTTNPMKPNSPDKPIIPSEGKQSELNATRVIQRNTGKDEAENKLPNPVERQYKGNEPDSSGVIKKLEIEVDFYKHKYGKEKELRFLASDKNFELQKENKALEEELAKLKIRNGDLENGKGLLNLNDLKKSGLTDDEVLSGIEASFEKFQHFLDMLEELGLGDLYNQMQETKQSDLPTTSNP